MKPSYNLYGKLRNNMKIIDELKIKENITAIECGNTVETIVSFIIRKDENGEIKYTPYFRETGFVVAIMKNLLHGVIFDKDDDLVKIYNEDEEIKNIIQDFINDNPAMEIIVDYVDDIVDFKKQLLINDFTEIKERLAKSIKQEQEVNSLNIKLLKKQNTLLSQQIKETEYNQKVMEYMSPEEVAEMNRKLASGEYDTSKVADLAIEKYISSELYKRNKKEVEEAKSGKIVNFSPTEDDGK